MEKVLNLIYFDVKKCVYYFFIHSIICIKKVTHKLSFFFHIVLYREMAILLNKTYSFLRFTLFPMYTNTNSYIYIYL